MTKRKSERTTDEWRTQAGHPITQTDADRMADEFESADPDLSGARITVVRRAGRPSLNGSSTPSPQVAFRVSEEIRREAQRLAAVRGTTVSALAREALEDLLRRTG